jgi:hypothetical protein
MLRIARAILTFELILGVFLSFVLDWSDNHLLDAAWHPQARFGGVLLLFFLAGASGIALWLLWRQSQEPRVAIDTAALITGAFWTPLFYVTAVLPGASVWAGTPVHEPHLMGVLFLPNLAVALLFLLAAAAASRIARIPDRPRKAVRRSA